MMTPGTYVRLRRQAIGMSLLDVAVRLDTEPHRPAHDRVDWLASIEADRAPVTERVAIALADVLPIDLVTISRLAANAAGARDVPAPRLCPHCAAGVEVSCSNADAVRVLRDLPQEIISVSRGALLRHCGLPDTIGGTVKVTLLAREAGWLPSIDGQYRRPSLIAEPRA